MKEGAAHFLQSPNNCTARSEDRFFPTKRKCLLKRRNQEGSWDQLRPAWFCWLVPLETHCILHTSPSSVHLLKITEHPGEDPSDYKRHFSIPECYVRAALYISIFIHRTYGRNRVKLCRGECCLGMLAATFSLQRKSRCLPVSSSHQIILLLQYHEADFILCTSRCSKC